MGLMWPVSWDCFSIEARMSMAGYTVCVILGFVFLGSWAMVSCAWPLEGKLKSAFEFSSVFVAGIYAAFLLKHSLFRG